MPRNEIISKIYDLRSRLGMIILLDKKINTNKEKMNKVIEEDNSDINDYSYEIKGALRNYKANQRDFYFKSIYEDFKVADDKLNDAYAKERDIEIKEWRKKRNIKILIAIPLTLIMLFVSFFIFISFYTSLFSSDILNGFSRNFYDYLSIIISIMLFIVLLQIIISTIKKLDFPRKQVAFNKYWSKRTETEKDIRAKYEEKMDNIEKENEYKEIKDKVNSKINTYKSKIMVKQQKSLNSLKELIETKEMINKQTHEQYDDFINPADYKNLDMILYLIETGRVTSIREALLDIDKRDFQNKMLNTFTEGFREIQNSINIGLNKLEKSINSKLSSIEERVNYFGNSIKAMDYRMDLLESNYEVMQREHIDAIEGLKFSMAIDSYEMSKQFNKAAGGVTDELRYISRNMMR